MDDAPITTREQARAWFQAMGCSHFHMMREDPDRYAQYEALAISLPREPGQSADRYAHTLAPTPEATGDTEATEQASVESTLHLGDSS